jgi:4-azaleucine resistance transporter AzlC
VNEGARPRSPVTAGVVLGVAVGVFGVSFGVLASASGLSVAKACALSLLVFTGASQFAAVSVVGRGGSSVAAIGSALLLAARNGVYGLTMAPILGPGRGSRVVAAQLVLDESTAMATAQPDAPSARRAFWATGLAIYACWNVGTLIGAVGGGAIGHPETLGLDAAFPAGFLALLVPHLKRMDGRRATLVGAGVSLVFIPFVPVGVPILVAVVGAFVGWRAA